jgi:hypothetical protein
LFGFQQAFYISGASSLKARRTVIKSEMFTLEAVNGGGLPAPSLDALPARSTGEAGSLSEPALAFTRKLLPDRQDTEVPEMINPLGD